MAQRWEPGARAVIVVSEHPRNANRIVELSERWAYQDNVGSPCWIVFDGKTFDGFAEVGKRRVAAYNLIIGQWKLRLLDDDDKVETREGIEYVCA